MKNKTMQSVLLAIMGVVIIALIVERITIIQKNTLIGVFQLAALVFTGLYVFWLYKIPHGNVLKYAMLLFALANLVSGSLFLLQGTNNEILRVLASAAVVYCAGRLDRINQNKYIMPIIAIAYLFVSIYWARYCIEETHENLIYILGRFNFTVNYLILMVAYFLRYKEHKEAGLMDAPKE